MKKVTLKSGRVVNHRPTGNQSSVTALMEDGQDMTEAEWEEYCAIVIKRNAAKIRRQELALGTVLLAAHYALAFYCAVSPAMALVLAWQGLTFLRNCR